MISWVVGFDGRVMGVVYDDTDSGSSDPVWNLVRRQFWWWKVQFEAKKQSL